MTNVTVAHGDPAHDANADGIAVADLVTAGLATVDIIAVGSDMADIAAAAVAIATVAMTPPARALSGWASSAPPAWPGSGRPHLLQD